MRTALCCSGLAARAVTGEPEEVFSPRALERAAPLAEAAFGTFSGWRPALMDLRSLDPLHQVALYLYGVAARDTWTERQPPPVAITGYSLGVYVALVGAGALDPADAMTLVHEAGQGVLEAQAGLGHALVAVNGLAVERVPDLISGILPAEDVALTHVNTRENFLLTAPGARAEELCSRALSLGAYTAAPAPFPGASHSRFMEPFLGNYFRSLESVEVRAPRIPLLSCVTATRVGTAAEARDLLRDQLIRTVLFARVVEQMGGYGVERFVVLGTCEGLPALLGYLRQDAEIRLFPGDGKGGGR